MRPSSGLTFGGRYQLSSRIAIGGMGEVWQATDLVIGRTVAIKILKDEYLGDPGFLERFRAEARHAALVNHEGIANVFDYGEEDGSAYLVMELVPGEALSAILERERTLPADKVLDIVAQTASALQAAHAAGLVHRDIKPGNLLITPEGRVKITDFGIARIADQVPLTATGQVMGTVQYLSPEQASGHPASPATDIYSLGIVAYEALAGKRPFTGESQVAIAMAQINEQPPDLPATVSEPVRNLVYACIAKNPADRPVSTAHLARAAQALRRGDAAAAAAAVPGVLGSRTGAATTVLPSAGGAPTQATQLLPAAGPVRTPSEPTDVPPRRSPWLWPLIALVALLSAVLIAVIVALVLPSGTPDGAQTSSAPPPPPTSSTPTPQPSQTGSNLVPLSLDDLAGRNQQQVQDYRTSIGLGLNAVTGQVAPTPEEVGLAYAANPTGNVRQNEVITVQFYAEIPPPPEATAPAAGSVTPSGPQPTGGSITFSWPTYQGCPSGFALSGFNVSAQGATLDTANPQSGSASSVDLTITAASGGQVSITYTAVCGSGNDAFESPASPASTVTVQ